MKLSWLHVSFSGYALDIEAVACAGYYRRARVDRGYHISIDARSIEATTAERASIEPVGRAGYFRRARVDRSAHRGGVLAEVRIVWVACIYIYIYILSASWKLPGRFLWFPSSTSPNVFVWFPSLVVLCFPSSQETLFFYGFRRWFFMVSVAAGNVFFFLWFLSRNVFFMVSVAASNMFYRGK